MQKKTARLQFTVRGSLEAGHSVLVVEKGPRAEFRRSLEMSRVRSAWKSVEQIKRRADDSTRCLFVGLGGTSNLWSGKWRSLDEADFQRAKENRRWPFQLSELDLHYQAVRKRFGFNVESDAFQTIRSHVANFDLRLVHVARSSSPVRLAEKWIGLESEYPQLRILNDVDKIEFHVDAGTVEWVRLTQHRGHVTEIGAHKARNSPSERARVE